MLNKTTATPRKNSIQENPLNASPLSFLAKAPLRFQHANDSWTHLKELVIEPRTGL